MTKRMLREELIGLKVFTNGGTEIGELNDIVIDTETGLVKYLLIKSYTNMSQDHKTDGKGRIICSVTDMKVIDGRMIIS